MVAGVLALSVLAACGGSGSGSGNKGERFGAQASPGASAPIGSSPRAPTRLDAAAVSGAYSIEIKLASGANAAACRNVGTVSETIAVQDQPGDRPITLTNDVPDAAGQKQSETGALRDDGTFEAAGSYTRGTATVTYTWHGSFGGDGSTVGTYTGTTPAANCNWQFTGRRK